MEKISFIKKFGSLTLKEKWVGGAVFFLAYLVYLLTLYPSVPAEDGGEFTTAVAALGVAHPPGYPLYVILGKVFTALIPFGTFAWKVNVFSALCGAVAAVFFYLCVKLFTRDDLSSFFGALLFAFGGIFWSQSVRAEVYTLNAALFLGILFLIFLWYEKRHDLTADESRRCLFLAAFLYGLSLGNHHLMLMAGPPLLLFAVLTVPRFFKDWRFLVKVFLFFCAGLAVYLYLPVRAAMQPDLNWGDPSTWQGFWDHVTRKLYGSSGVDPSMRLQVSGSRPGPEILSGWWIDGVARYHVWQMGVYFLQHFVEDYFWGLLFFVPFGWWWFRKRSAPYSWVFAALIVFNVFVLSALLGLGYAGKLPVDLFKDRPFYIPGLAVLCFLAVVGVPVFTQKFLKGPLRHGAWFFLGAVVFFQIVFQFSVRNQSGNYIAYDLARFALDILPPNAVYIVQNSDNTLFPILYLNKVEGLRQDVTFYIPSPINVYRFFTTLEDVERGNPGKRVFTDFPFTEYRDRTYTHYGPVSEIVRTQDLESQKKVLPLLETRAIRGVELNRLDHFHQYLQGRFILDTALAYGKIDDGRQSELFTLSMITAPESVNIFSQLIGNYYVRRGMFAEALPFLESAITFYPDDYPLNFQLFLAHVLSGDPQGAMPSFTTLLEKHKDLFLGEYEKVKNLFSDRADEFEIFERSIRVQ